MLGHYENFPLNIHYFNSFSMSVSSRKIQEKALQAFFEVNKKEFSFEEVAIPTVPDGIVIFEFGLAEQDGFAFLDGEEAKKALNVINKKNLNTMDFFCSIRYYKNVSVKRVPLKFDYYLLRLAFARGEVGFQVFHERGPRYLSPEDLVAFIIDKLNEKAPRKILNEKETTNTPE